MPDEPTQVEAPATTEVPTGEAAPATPLIEEPTAAQTPDWRELLNEVDPEELSKHPKFAGVLGSRLQRAIANFEQNKMHELSTKAKREQEDELIRLANENPEVLEKQYNGAFKAIKELEQMRALDDVQGLRGKTVTELATFIGQSVTAVPEWKDLTEKDFERLRSEMAGKPDHEAMAIFNRLAIDLIAEKRAEKKQSDWTAKQLVKEREALRNEIAAEMLQNSEAPDMTRSKGQPSGQWYDTADDEEFNREYEKRYKR